MSLFKHKIISSKAKDFFNRAVPDLVSDEELETYKTKLSQLVDVMPELKNISAEKFSEHLAAVNLALFYGAWLVWIYKRTGSAAVHDEAFLVDEAVKNNKINAKFVDLYELYKGVSGYKGPNELSGVDSIARLFISELFGKELPQNFTELSQNFAFLFDKSMQSFTSDFKRLKLIS